MYDNGITYLYMIVVTSFQRAALANEGFVVFTRMLKVFPSNQS